MSDVPLAWLLSIKMGVCRQNLCTLYIWGEKMNYTYMVRCSDGSLYTGWTNQLEKRLEAHNLGKGAKYTKARRPVELVYAEGYETKQEAMKREYELKQLNREDKLALIEGWTHTFFPVND